MPKSQISGPFPPIENIFFCKKRFSLSFYISKTIEKTLGHLILRTFAIFNPTYYLMCSTTTSSRTFYLMCSMNTSSSTSSFPSLMSSMSCKSKKPKKCAKKEKKEKKKNWGWQLSSWQKFFFGGGKCPNLGVVNVRILGVVNVRLANNLTPC